MRYGGREFPSVTAAERSAKTEVISFVVVVIEPMRWEKSWIHDFSAADVDDSWIRLLEAYDMSAR